MVTGGSRVRRHVWIKGYVQGVNFRNAAKQAADQMGVTGWVKNLEDRRVEAVFEATPDAMEKMISWCKRGPPAARVDELEVRSEPATSEFFQFRILR